MCSFGAYVWEPTLAHTHTRARNIRGTRRETRELFEIRRQRERETGKDWICLDLSKMVLAREIKFRTFSAVMSGVMYVVTAVVYTLR